MRANTIAKAKCTQKDMIGAGLLLKVTMVCEVSWDIPNHSSIDCGGLVSERMPGVRGGKGTSQPNFTIAEKKPPMRPTMIAGPMRRRAGSVLVSNADTRRPPWTATACRRVVDLDADRAWCRSAWHGALAGVHGSGMTFVRGRAQRPAQK